LGALERVVQGVFLHSVRRVGEGFLDGHDAMLVYEVKQEFEQAIIDRSTSRVVTLAAYAAC
jgi:hypothetical protein